MASNNASFRRFWRKIENECRAGSEADTRATRMPSRMAVTASPAAPRARLRPRSANADPTNGRAPHRSLTTAKSAMQSHPKGVVIMRSRIFALSVALFGLCPDASASALNVIQTKSAIHFFADTGAYRSDGTIAEFRPKVFAMPQARAAIGIVGPLPIISTLPRMVESAVSLEDLVKDTQRAARALFLSIRTYEIFGVDPDKRVTVIVGGYTAAGEIQIWQLSAAVSEENPQIIRSAADAWSFTPALKTPPNFEALTTSPESAGLAVLEDQRRTPNVVADWNSGKPTYVVGGAAHLTTVSFDAITSRILRRWPDVIGQPIFGDQR